MESLEEYMGRRGQILGAVAAAAILLLLSGAGRANAAPTLVTDCPGPTATTLAVTSTQRLAQTFTSGVTGNLSRGEIEVTKPAASNGDWTMEIFAVSGGTPTGSPLASTTISDSTVSTGDSRIVGTFAPGLTLQSGVAYALSLSRAAGWTLRDRNSDPCPNGREFRSTTASGAWANEDAYGGASFDFVFAVYAEPLPPPPASTPTPTGLRAAALRDCKKRAKKHTWSKPRLKKCKKKAEALPV